MKHTPIPFGTEFGFLTVIGDAVVIHEPQNKQNRYYYPCLCYCGGFAIASQDKLKLGRKRSCGCLEVENRMKPTHGLGATRVYNIWNHMHRRCYDPNCPAFRWYGAKGVSICAEWFEPEPFATWASANGYDDTLTIDRINPFGDYEPSNCRWIPLSEQAKNKRCHALLKS